MLGWFDAKKAEEFGTSLAQFFIERIPANHQLNDNKLASKTEYLLVKMQAQIKTFKEHEKLNIYKTAKLANAFRWTLKDGGFQEGFVEKLVEWLVTHL